jgi:hypothetical protein
MQAKANAARSKVRSAIETVFAAQKHRFGLFVRTLGHLEKPRDLDSVMIHLGLGAEGIAMARQPGLFDLDERYRKLSGVGDPLTRLKGLSTSRFSGRRSLRL